MNFLQLQVLQVFPLGVWLALTCTAAPVASMDIFENITVDDSSARLQYLPEDGWTLGSTPSVQLDPSQVSGSTWHGATGHSQDTSPKEIHLNFTVYVFCVIANRPPQAPEKMFDSFAAYKFLIDGVVVGEFRHEAEDTAEYLYNTPVYTNTSLSNEEHHFTVLIDSTNRSAMILFDYIVYTMMQPPSASLSTTFSSPPIIIALDVTAFLPPIIVSLIDAATSLILPMTQGILTTSFVPYTTTSPPQPSVLPSTRFDSNSASTPTHRTIMQLDSSSASTTHTYTDDTLPFPSLDLDKNTSTETRKANETVAIVSGTLGSVVFFMLATTTVLFVRRRATGSRIHVPPSPLRNTPRVDSLSPEDLANPVDPPPRNQIARLSALAPNPPATGNLDQSLVAFVTGGDYPDVRASCNEETNYGPPDYGLLDDPLPSYAP
ncbi:hypothetical protein AB1N83_011721 [Pleurotus pulmonarius]